ncbi:MAG: SCP2 domain-containing protein [Thiotrichales bacterium]
MADDFLTSTLERLVTGYLALDPETAIQFGELEGRVLRIDCTFPPLSLCCLPRSGAIAFSTRHEGEVDCRVRGSAAALLRLARTEQPTTLLASGEVAIDGDSRMVQRFADLLKQLEIDWEELLSKVVGDFAAHRIGGVARDLQTWGGRSAESLRRDTTEYLQEESGLLPTRLEIERFIAEVDELRLAAARLEARLKRLERQLPTPAAESGA